MKSSTPFVEGGGWKTAFTFKRQLYTALAVVGFVLSLMITLILHGLDEVYQLHWLWLGLVLIPGELVLIGRAVRYSSAEKQALKKMKAPPAYHPRNLY